MASPERQLDELLSAAADDGFDAPRVQALEGLLREHPELEPAYRRWMGLLVTLPLEFSLSGGPMTLPNECLAVGGGPARRPRGPGVVWWAATAASLAVVAGLVGWAVWPPAEPDPSAAVARAGTPGGVSPEDADAASAGPPVVGPALSRSWPRLRVASFSAGRDEAPLALVSSPVWLERFNSYPARGYVVPVGPGDQIDVAVDASAAGANRLVVLELDGSGEPLRQAIMFTNDTPETSPSRDPYGPGRRVGRLGRWTERNDTPGERYYLLAGLHRLHEAPADRQWRVSDFAVLIREPHLLHIGWDDSGVNADADWPADESALADEHGYLADRDYDDVSVSVRVFDPLGRAKRPERRPRTFPSSEADGALTDADMAGFAFTVEPGEAVVMRAIRGSIAEHRIAVADAATREVLWDREQLRPLQASPNRFSNHPAALARNREAFGVENTTDASCRFVVAVRVPDTPNDGAPSAAGAWRPAPHRVLLEADEYQIVGFQKGPEDTRFQDIWVTLHRVPR